MTSYLLIALFLLINTTIAVLFKTIALGQDGSSYMALDPRFYLTCILFAAQAAVWLAVLRRLPLLYDGDTASPSFACLRPAWHPAAFASPFRFG